MAQGYSENRAPVSGPGKFSQRTDRQGVQALPNAGYGESKDFEQIQQGAPMERQKTPSVTPLSAPTARPNEAIGSGSRISGGPGPEALGIASPAEAMLNDLGKIGQYLPIMEQYANSPMSSGTMKSFVRYLRSQQQ